MLITSLFITNYAIFHERNKKIITSLLPNLAQLLHSSHGE